MKVFEFFPVLSFLFLIVQILVRIIYLKNKGIKISANNKKTSKSKVLINILFLLFLLFYIFETVRPLLTISFSILPEYITTLLFESLYLKIAGILIITFSLVFFQITLFHFKKSLRFGLDQNNQGSLITTGVFSISRNPFFLSIEMYFLGIALLLPNIFFIGFSVLAVISIHFFILKEEKFMRKVYGAEYEKYKQQVRRYF